MSMVLFFECMLVVVEARPRLSNFFTSTPRLVLVRTCQAYETPEA